MIEIQNKSEKAIIFADWKEMQKILQKVSYKTLKISPPLIIKGVKSNCTSSPHIFSNFVKS